MNIGHTTNASWSTICLTFLYLFTGLDSFTHFVHIHVELSSFEFLFEHFVHIGHSKTPPPLPTNHCNWISCIVLLHHLHLSVISISHWHFIFHSSLPWKQLRCVSASFDHEEEEEEKWKLLLKILCGGKESSSVAACGGSGSAWWQIQVNLYARYIGFTFEVTSRETESCWTCEQQHCRTVHHNSLC